MKTKKREYLFDSECYELAAHFLPSGSPELRSKLAQDIQDCVESFCEGETRCDAIPRETAFTSVRLVTTIHPDAIDELKSDWPKGCAPPTRYVEWHNWAEAQDAHGLKQTPCKHCKRFFFPQEKSAHMRCQP
jgi:hypothetical protein